MRLTVLGLAAFAVATQPLVATAEPIAIESYGGPRPEEAATVIPALLGSLAKHGFVTDGALQARIEQEVSRSGAPLDRADADAIATRAEEGFATFRKGQFEEAVTILDQVWAAIVAHPSTVAARQELRDSEIKTLLGLSLANQRLGNQEVAIKHMGEFLRSFPDREISRAQYGPEPAELAKKVRAEMARGAQGALRVEVLDDPGGAVVFVNERYVSVGSAELDNLSPGVYRVLVRGKLNGRVHDVNVEPGSKKLLQVRLAAESALRTDGRSVALTFPDEDERATSEAAGAASIGSALRAPEVAVIGIRTINGRRTLIGALIAADTGRPIRSGSLVMEPMTPSNKQLAALARFIASGEGDPDLQVGDAATGGGGPMQDTTTTRPWFKDTWGWVLVGSGIVVAGTGVGFLVNASGLEDDAAAEPDERKRGELRDTADSRRTIGMIATALGAVVVVAGVVKLAWPNRRERRNDSTRVAIGMNWIGLEGSF